MVCKSCRGLIVLSKLRIVFFLILFVWALYWITDPGSCKINIVPVWCAWCACFSVFLFRGFSQYMVSSLPIPYITVLPRVGGPFKRITYICVPLILTSSTSSHFILVLTKLTSHLFQRAMKSPARAKHISIGFYWHPRHARGWPMARVWCNVLRSSGSPKRSAVENNVATLQRRRGWVVGWFDEPPANH